jgi:hypothetical protein
MFEVFSSSSAVSVSNIAIVCCRACRSHPIIRISASFDPSSVRSGHRTVYSARCEADFVMPSVTCHCGYEMDVFKILRGYLPCLLFVVVAFSANSSLVRLFASPCIHAQFSNTRIRATDEKTTAACFKRSPFEAYFETTSCL